MVTLFYTLSPLTFPAKPSPGSTAVIVGGDAGPWGLKLTQFGDPHYGPNVSVEIQAMAMILSVMVFAGRAFGR